MALVFGYKKRGYRSLFVILVYSTFNSKQIFLFLLNFASADQKPNIFLDICLEASSLDILPVT